MPEAFLRTAENELHDLGLAWRNTQRSEDGIQVRVLRFEKAFQGAFAKEMSHIEQGREVDRHLHCGDEEVLKRERGDSQGEIEKDVEAKGIGDWGRPGREQRSSKSRARSIFCRP